MLILDLLPPGFLTIEISKLILEKLEWIPTFPNLFFFAYFQNSEEIKMVFTNFSAFW